VVLFKKCIAVLDLPHTNQGDGCMQEAPISANHIISARASLLRAADLRYVCVYMNMCVYVYIHIRIYNCVLIGGYIYVDLLHIVATCC